MSFAAHSSDASAQRPLTTDTPAAASRSRRGPGLRPCRASTSSGVAFGPTSVNGGRPPGILALRGAGQVKGVVERQEHAEHFGAADDGDRAVR